ncbi:MAG: TrkA family potassium uptake protein [Gammaproteobacteria bacterium]|nr:TrkA family potassium uptake protein [Gammaproteobacteria bacterium]
MSQQIAIFGSGELGQTLAQSLQDIGKKLTLFDHHADKVASAQAKGFDAQYLDFKNDELLKKAGVGDSLELLFALFEDDSENVFLCLSSRALAPELRIMAVSHQPDATHRLKAAGADKVIDPHHLSARRIYQIMTRPLVAEVLEHTIFGQQDLELVEIAISKDLSSKISSIGELQLKDFNVVLVGYLGQSEIIEPELGYLSPDHPIKAGDVLLVVGKNEAIEKVKKFMDIFD